MSSRSLSTLRTETYIRLAESGSGFYTDAQINQWLADGARRIAVDLEPLLNSATAATTTDTAEYALPEDTLSVRSALFLNASDDWESLEETTWETLLGANPAFESDTSGFPQRWYQRGPTIIGLWPAPSSTYAGADTLRVVYTYLPVSMSGESDTSGLPEYLDDAVVLYAVYRAYLKDRAFQHAEATAQEYARLVGEGGAKLQKQRQQMAPRMQPSSRSYRQFYQSRMRRVQITST